MGVVLSKTPIFIEPLVWVEHTTYALRKRFLSDSWNRLFTVSAPV